jgi:hypothetical protein
LVNADTGSGDEAASRAQGEWLAGPIDAVLAPGGVVISDQDMTRVAPHWLAQELPSGIAPGRYFLFRKPA